MTGASGPAGHRFDPTILREYDIRGVVGETLSAAERMRNLLNKYDFVPRTLVSIILRA